MSKRLYTFMLMLAAWSNGFDIAAQTSKYLPGDTLLIPAATSVDVVGDSSFTTTQTIRAVLVAKRYPFWFVDFDLSNAQTDSTKVGNSLFLRSGVVNLSLEARDAGLEFNRKYARMGIDAAAMGGNVQRALGDLADEGIPVLMKFSFEKGAEGGIEPKVRIFNISDRSIRGVGVDFRGYDAQGQLVDCRKSGATDHSVRLNGLIEPDAECYFAFINDPAFFNPETVCLEIDSVTVDFVGGERIVMDEELAKIQQALRAPFMRTGECPG